MNKVNMSLSISEIDNGWLLSAHYYDPSAGPMAGFSSQRFYETREKMMDDMPGFTEDTLIKAQRAAEGLAEKNEDNA